MEEVFFYGFDGRMATYQMQWQGTTLRMVEFETAVYFAGRMVRRGTGWIATDRLGSLVARISGGTTTRLSYYPYGEEKSSTPNDREKFGTY